MKYRTGLAVIACSLLLPLSLLSEEKDTPEVKAEDLRGEINLINLVNGLNLTEEQLTRLIAINKEVAALKESYKEKAKTFSDDLVKSLEDLKKSLIEEGPNLPPKVGEKASHLNEQAKELDEEFKAELPSYQEKIDAVLSDAQKEVINTFKPCLLPPKSQKDPVRAGQAQTHEMEINILRRLRQIPDDVYKEKRTKTLQHQFEKFEKQHGNLTEGEKLKEEERLFALVDKVRALSDEDFELNKEELAGQFLIKDKAEELSEQLKSLTEYRGKHKPKMSKSGRYFLDPRMRGILEAKLEVLKNFQPRPPKNLDEECPSCEEGKGKKK